MHLLVQLRPEGQIAPKPSPNPAAIAEEINRFERYLTQVCGLSPATCSVRLRRVRAFLLDRFAAERIQISALKPTDVVRFNAQCGTGVADHVLGQQGRQERYIA